jgi:hypothetical protein
MDMKRIKELAKIAATLTYLQCTTDEANYRRSEIASAKRILKNRSEKGLKDVQTATQPDPDRDLP